MTERIALVSDVHGNLTALEAVLADIDSRGIARPIGDYVGKGPRGREVVELCRERCEVNLLGDRGGFLPDLVGYGDTHDPFYECQLERRTAFNTGSVGNCMGDPTPLCCILEGVLDSEEPSPWSVACVRVPYDVEDERAEAHRLGMPEYESYELELRHGSYARWLEEWRAAEPITGYHERPVATT